MYYCPHLDFLKFAFIYHWHFVFFYLHQQYIRCNHVLMLYSNVITRYSYVCKLYRCAKWSHLVSLISISIQVLLPFMVLLLYKYLRFAITLGSWTSLAFSSGAQWLQRQLALIKIYYEIVRSSHYSKNKR